MSVRRRATVVVAKWTVSMAALFGCLSGPASANGAGPSTTSEILAVAGALTPAQSVRPPLASPLYFGIPRQKPDVPPISPLITDDDYDLVIDAFDAIAKRRWKQARLLIDKVEDNVARDILQWNLLTRKNTNATFEEVLSFAERRSDWPRFSNILRLAEETIPNDMPADQIIAWFAGQEPLTGEGKLRLGEAYLELGQGEFGKVWIERAWIEHNFGSKREREIFKVHKKNISQAAHDQRLERLLWQRQHTKARRIMPYASQDAKTIAKARMRISANPRGASGEVHKLPQRLRSNPGVLFDEVHQTRRMRKDDKVRPLLLAAPGDADGMVNPDKWWIERHLQARKAHNKGEFLAAYKIAASNGLTRGAKFAEAEFLAGWLALRYLSRPDQALKHFEKLETGVSFPISLSRARYWQGRAHEALGDAERARETYLGAGEFPYTYYGQLALANPIVAAPALILPDQTPIRENMVWSFENQDFVKAIRLLHAFDRGRDVRSFFYHYSDNLERQEDFTLLSGLADEMDYPHYSIRVAKKAMQKNIALVTYSYPIGSIPKYEGKGKPPEPAFVFGLSRQESEFNPRAVSSAGARGLMQLIPSTARLTARKHGLPYQTAWLLDDPTYNTQLGMAHLSDMLKRFDGSYILTIAAYNAGAHRVDTWLKDYGDPRSGNVDPIDWVESIPFKETRNYVQRVLENTQVYRNRISGRSEPIQIVQDLARPNTRSSFIRLPTVRASIIPTPVLEETLQK
jgi:peptidoglycan lytic transglycosylase